MVLLALRRTLKLLLIKSLIWLKNSNKYTRGIAIITGQVETVHRVKKTGEIVKDKYPIQLVGLGAGFFNTINNNLKYALAKWIGGSNSGEYIGANGLMTQASSNTKDGMGETNGYPYTTTKDSGGTGSQNWIKFKGVRTAAGAESHANMVLGLAWDTGADDVTTEYASQTISKTLASGDVFTVYWTITIN